jgi:hypothetical protein
MPPAGGNFSAELPECKYVKSGLARLPNPALKGKLMKMEAA